MIAALLLTYGDNALPNRSRRAPIRKKIVPRRVNSIMARVHTEEELIAAMRTSRKKRPERDPKIAALQNGNSEGNAQKRAETTPVMLRRRTTAQVSAVPTEPSDNIFSDEYGTPA